MKKAFIVSTVVCLFISGVSSAITVQGIDLDFVTIGNAGNAADSTGYGAVGYDYQIGTYEITASQWSTINTAAGIGDAGYWSGNQPTASISWYDAARFCNYLTTGNTETGVYTFTAGSLTSIMDHETAGSTYGRAYFLPTEDEWYKAAYYTGSGYSLYANGTNTAPIEGTDTNYDYAIGQPWEVGVGNGTEEQNGTFDMMGNVWEWNETQIGSYRGVRGGSYYYLGVTLSSSHRAYYSPGYEYGNTGFRVASVPEPCSLVLLGIGAVLMRKRR
ncbi:MAG: SUMF1/EgtB/PvdO family nonheme iron enzyme [Syntrophaceae bacterium]|nr:SUMF1/EgtB/PvdO family nonheme iron enzyme [Syntrophaceae bacterium]